MRKARNPKDSWPIITTVYNGETDKYLTDLV